MRILQIAYYYPPMGGAGVQRALKFSKYLPEFGVQPVVLAAHDPDYMTDASLAGEIPASVALHRVEHRPLLQRVLAWRARAAPPTAGVASTAVAEPSPARAALRDAVLGAYAAVQFPDDKAGWARRAHAEARRILRGERIDLIFSSSPPASAHALAARLAREFGLPWVADFRDLWTDNPGYAAPGWRRALDRRRESDWLRRATGIVTVTPSWQRMLAQRAGPACPVAFIPNGYDETDFGAVEAVPREAGCCRVVHAGTLYGHQSPQPLLAAAEDLLTCEPALAARLRLRFVGLVGGRFEPLLAGFAARFPGVLERTGFVEHGRAVAEMLAADLLLLIVGGGAAARGVLPGKIFEYLRAGRPVLLLGDEQGDAAELVRGHASGWVVDAAQTSRIAEALQAMLAAPPVARGAEAGTGVQRFERRELSRQLAEFLAQCAGRHHERD